jgi:hypothetical protein
MIGCSINNGLESIWKEVAVARFKVISQHLPGGTNEKNEKPQSG